MKRLAIILIAMLVCSACDPAVVVRQTTQTVQPSATPVVETGETSVVYRTNTATYTLTMTSEYFISVTMTTIPTIYPTLTPTPPRPERCNPLLENCFFLQEK